MINLSKSIATGILINKTFFKITYSTKLWSTIFCESSTSTFIPRTEEKIDNYIKNRQ